MFSLCRLNMFNLNCIISWNRLYVMKNAYNNKNSKFEIEPLDDKRNILGDVNIKKQNGEKSTKVLSSVFNNMF